jgi:DNA-binding transcriptional regulator YiaG
VLTNIDRGSARLNREATVNKPKGTYTEAGTEIIGALTEFRDTIRAKILLDQKFTVRTVEIDLKPSPYAAVDVQKTRAILNVSQANFAAFLGVDVKPVHSWEQGAEQPSPIVCRFMDEIAHSPEHWRKRLRQSITSAPVNHE